jgi:hypothetical protein
MTRAIVKASVRFRLDDAAAENDSALVPPPDLAAKQIACDIHRVALEKSDWQLIRHRVFRPYVWHTAAGVPCDGLARSIPMDQRMQGIAWEAAVMTRWAQTIGRTYFGTD